VFEPFFTTKPMHQAIGLGLPRVYRILRDHRGAVGIESAPRHGTTVHLLVPLAADSPEAAAQPAASARRPAAAGPAKEATVLVVDDEEIVRSSLRRALARSGYRVLEAWDGPTALTALQSAQPRVDLVILDLVLPGGGAGIFELLKAVQPDLRVLVSSGYSPDADQAKALASRADGFLPKPYELTELRGAVARALEGGPAAA
jgi:CheY-like chemotaxis protein